MRRRPQQKLNMTQSDTRLFWRVVILAGVLSCLPFVLTAIWYYYPKSPRDVRLSLFMEQSSGSPDKVSINTSASASTGEQFYLSQITTYYPSFQQAVDAFHPSAGIRLRRISGKVFQFENDDAATAYYWCDNGKAGPIGLCSVFTVKKNCNYSNVLEGGFTFTVTDPEKSFMIGRYRFTPEETVANYLSDEFLVLDRQSLPNDGRPTFFGISTDPTINNLRILDEPPTRIVKSRVRGKTYYVWIYEGLDLKQGLLDSIDANSGSFTLGRLIDALGIHFASSGDKRSQEVPIVNAPYLQRKSR